MAAGQRTIRLAEIDAVTIDGYGTLLELHDPLEKLHALVPDRPRDDVARAFEAEAAFYRARSQEGRDPETLARLHAACAAVFNGELGSNVSPTAFVGALEFAIVDGVEQALRSLRARGLALAVVANWDFGLHEHLRRHGLETYFDTVVTSAEAAAKKPDAAPFRLALEALGVRAERTVHVGDHEDDERGAAAAGIAFEPAPLAGAVARWT